MLEGVPHSQVAGACRALAGLSGSLSVGAGFIAARAAPHGFSQLAIAMHLKQAPLAVRIAPYFALIAAVIAIAAGIVSFYAWCHEQSQRRGASSDAI